jgi:hypothetical protein
MPNKQINKYFADSDNSSNGDNFHKSGNFSSIQNTNKIHDRVCNNKSMYYESRGGEPVTTSPGKINTKLETNATVPIDQNARNDCLNGKNSNAQSSYVPCLSDHSINESSSPSDESIINSIQENLNRSIGRSAKYEENSNKNSKEYRDENQQVNASVIDTVNQYKENEFSTVPLSTEINHATQSLYQHYAPLNVLTNCPPQPYLELAPGSQIIGSELTSSFTSGSSASHGIYNQQAPHLVQQPTNASPYFIYQHYPDYMSTSAPSMIAMSAPSATVATTAPPVAQAIASPHPNTNTSFYTSQYTQISPYIQYDPALMAYTTMGYSPMTPAQQPTALSSPQHQSIISAYHTPQPQQQNQIYKTVPAVSLATPPPSSACSSEDVSTHSNEDPSKCGSPESQNNFSSAIINAESIQSQTFKQQCLQTQQTPYQSSTQIQPTAIYANAPYVIYSPAGSGTYLNAPHAAYSSSQSAQVSPYMIIASTSSPQSQSNLQNLPQSMPSQSHFQSPDKFYNSPTVCNGKYTHNKNRSNRYSSYSNRRHNQNNIYNTNNNNNNNNNNNSGNTYNNSNYKLLNNKHENDNATEQQLTNMSGQQNIISNYLATNSDKINHQTRSCGDESCANVENLSNQLDSSVQGIQQIYAAPTVSNVYDYYDPNLFAQPTDGTAQVYANYDYSNPNNAFYYGYGSSGEEYGNECYEEDYLETQKEEQLACTICRGRRMCFCYFLKVKYYKFPSFFDLVDHQYKKWRSSVVKKKSHMINPQLLN